MRLKDKSLSFVLNFLLGIAWAIVFIGAVSSFSSVYQSSFFYALISAFAGALPGMVGVLFLEHVFTTKQKHEELQKQTKLLQQLLNRIEEK